MAACKCFTLPPKAPVTGPTHRVRWQGRVAALLQRPQDYAGLR